jgi:para-aminobenzoate synthetase component I
VSGARSTTWVDQHRTQADPKGRPRPVTYHRLVTATHPPLPRGRERFAPRDDDRGVHLERLPELDGLAPMDVAEAFRDLPGLALLESARPGRKARWSFLTADPVAILQAPTAERDPFADARRLVARLDPGQAAAEAPGEALPPFLGGLVGYLGYDLGHDLERLPTIARDDQGLPRLRLALHDWVVAFDRRHGQAWLAGRAVDQDRRDLAGRLAAVRARLERGRGPGSQSTPDVRLEPLSFRSSLDRVAYESGVERVRAAIAHGDIYQANLTRRLSTLFRADPWPLYRALRTGDPALFAAYLDLGDEARSGGGAASPEPAGRPGRRAIVSASPEPFLSVDRLGHVATDPIKGTRPRGATPEEDRALAAELFASAKDRAENVMIVDVLRNDLGRVCRPGSVRVPRLCRLERTAAVQHLVSTVTGRLARGRDAFDLLAASFPGGSITGAPKIRAMEILEELEPVRRGPYTGAALWLGPDGALASSILIRTLVADGALLSLNVGGGITWRSDPAAEWDETVAKARGPLRAIGGREVA